MSEIDEYNKALERKRFISKRMDRRFDLAIGFSAITLIGGGGLVAREVKNGGRIDSLAITEAVGIILGSEIVVSNTRRYKNLKKQLAKTNEDIQAMRDQNLRDLKEAITGLDEHQVTSEGNGGYPIEDLDLE